MRLGLLILVLLLTGCSHHAPPINGRLSDSITVIAELNDQLGKLAWDALSLWRHES
ncbi:Uncharacterised protein [Pantoea agglomerans]|uniref:Uncharacterized protein n=1 Tax=Enterobacter agglomerans TaxID=549 RepID=A0A379AHM4_ENTAG|nr:Uncharacterised protein [Pantoea agglomerans]